MRRHFPVSVIAMATTVIIQETHPNDESVDLGARID